MFPTDPFLVKTHNKDALAPIYTPVLLTQRAMCHFSEYKLAHSIAEKHCDLAFSCFSMFSCQHLPGTSPFLEKFTIKEAFYA